MGDRETHLGQLRGRMVVFCLMVMPVASDVVGA
jgi:hypothetical protein